MPSGTAATAPRPPALAGELGPAGDTWAGVTDAPLDASALGRWATTPDVGAVVTFSGTVRDHAPGRDGVTALTYEAYEEAAIARIRAVVDDTRGRWPAVRRVAAVHRTGRLTVGEVAVVVAVAAPHREAAFAAAAHCIDTLKATVPLWKKETWAGGEEWGTDATAIENVRPGGAGGESAEADAPASRPGGPAVDGVRPDGLVGPAAAPGARGDGASPSRRPRRASAGTAGAALRWTADGPTSDLASGSGGR